MTKPKKSTPNKQNKKYKKKSTTSKRTQKINRKSDKIKKAFSTVLAKDLKVFLDSLENTEYKYFLPKRCDNDNVNSSTKQDKLCKTVDLAEVKNIQNKIQALQLEIELQRDKLGKCLKITFPDPDITTNIVMGYVPDLVDVLFEAPRKRYCYTWIDKSANIDEVVGKLKQNAFYNNKHLDVEIVEHPKLRSPNTKWQNIDPYVLCVKNIPNNMNGEKLKTEFPMATKIGVRHSQRTNEKYAFVHFDAIEQSISAFRKACNLAIETCKLIIRFRRTNDGSEQTEDVDSDLEEGDYTTNEMSSATEIEPSTSNSSIDTTYTHPTIDSFDSKQNVLAEARKLLGNFMNSVINIDDDDDKSTENNENNENENENENESENENENDDDLSKNMSSTIGNDSHDSNLSDEWTDFDEPDLSIGPTDFNLRINVPKFGSILPSPTKSTSNLIGTASISLKNDKKNDESTSENFGNLLTQSDVNTNTNETSLSGIENANTIGSSLNGIENSNKSIVRVSERSSSSDKTSNMKKSANESRTKQDLICSSPDYVIEIREPTEIINLESCDSTDDTPHGISKHTAPTNSTSEDIIDLTSENTVVPPRKRIIFELDDRTTRKEPIKVTDSLRSNLIGNEENQKLNSKSSLNVKSYQSSIFGSIGKSSSSSTVASVPFKVEKDDDDIERQRYLDSLFNQLDWDNDLF